MKHELSPFKNRIPNKLIGSGKDNKVGKLSDTDFVVKWDHNLKNQEREKCRGNFSKIII